MVHEAEDHAPGLVHGQVRRVAARVAAWTEYVELREGLAETRHHDDLSEGSQGYDDPRGEGDPQPSVQGAVFLPVRDREINGQGKTLVRRRRMRRRDAAWPTPTVKMAIATTIGTKRMPHGVKFSSRRRRGTTAMVKPKDRAMRSIQSISRFLGGRQPGSSAVFSAHPGAKTIQAKAECV